MNDHASPMSYMDGERSSSPKRKKIRQKYAPKACVSCRRSKLKCTGENPCQRCIDNGKRCFYSEDQTAAEVLQNLSRPTPSPASQAATNNGHGNGNGNGNLNGTSPQNLMPPNNLLDRRASEISNMMPTMEERMARVEKMMEALMQERGLGFTPSGSIEREQSIGFRSETVFSMPILDPIHPALDQMAQPPPEQMQDSLLPAAPAIGSDASAFVRAGNQNVPFPDPGRYQQYVAHFFGHVHLRRPCVDEADFNARVQQIVTNGATGPSDIHFLASCYVIFACCDALLTEVLATTDSGVKPPGWQWYELADSIVDKTMLLTSGDDQTLILYLLFQAVYLAYTDMPALAYAAMRTTCTAVLQQNLHQQPMWRGNDPVQMYWRICLFWNVYLTDRTISISCGRPPSFHIEDVNVEMPDAFADRIQLNMGLHDNGQRHAANLYLKYEILTSDLASRALHVGRSASDSSTDFLFILSEIMQCSETGGATTLDTLASLQLMSHPILQFSAALKRFSVPLIVGRNIMTTYNFKTETADRLIATASDALRAVCVVRREAPVSPSCRHQLTSLVAGILLLLGALLLRDYIPATDKKQSQLSHGDYIEQSMTAASILSDLAQELPYARRVQKDLSAVMKIISRMSEKWRSLSRAQQSSQDWTSFAAELLPPDPLVAIPYQDTSPPLQGHEGWDGTGGRSGVLWLF